MYSGQCCLRGWVVIWHLFSKKIKKACQSRLRIPAHVLQLIRRHFKSHPNTHLSADFITAVPFYIRVISNTCFSVRALHPNLLPPSRTAPVSWFMLPFPFACARITTALPIFFRIIDFYLSGNSPQQDCFIQIRIQGIYKVVPV